MKRTLPYKIFCGVTLIIFFSNILSKAQTQRVTVEKISGEKIQLSVDLISYNSKAVFEDDIKGFIKGKIGDETVKINKSEISKITLFNGQVYQVISAGENSSNYYIGYFISTDSTLKILKTYQEELESTNLGSFGGTNGVERAMYTTKKVTKEYFYLFDEGKIKSLRTKQDLKKIATDCERFKKYLDRVKGKEFSIAKAVSVALTNCTNKP